MSVPSTSELKKLAEDIYVEARKEGTLSSLTPRLVRQQIEEKMDLEKGLLDEKKYKTAIGDAISEARSKLQKANNDGAGGTSEEEKKGEESEEEDHKNSSESKQPRGKKRKSVEASSKGRSSASTKEKFKSAEFIPASDGEEDEAVANLSRVSSEDDETKASKPPPKKRKKATPASSSPAKSELSTSKGMSSPTLVEDNDTKSDSDMSEVVDEPKQRSKGKSKGKQASAKKGKGEKKSTATLSKDEATIKRLKGFVIACGVRKVWSKLFEGIEDQPSKQIQMLRDMLTDLGMTGRPSMEQAKAIKAKRDLASELEDVQSFEKAILGQGTRRSRQATEEKQQEEGSESEEETARPAKRKTNARQSIMAFLEDQSDSE
ncbi:hypothetical protein PQX77_004497 [Marasmius sp. AFHP31]|nr:hypothetical protein PQX77_004497 [Marasmius sp. AFHP31]